MLQYTETYDNPNCIRVDVVGSRDNMSWAILDRSTGQIVRECMRGEFLFPGLTDDELQEAREFIKKLRTAPFKDAYIRFGKLPRSGKSKNYATGQLEDGVSCYSARWNIVSGSYEREGGLDGAAIKYLIKGEPIYLICGTECGRGSDGEPLVKNAEIVAELQFDKELDGYTIKKNAF